MKYTLFQGNCLDRLPKLATAKCLFADPFDNIGLGYDEYKDKMPDDEYVKFLHDLVLASVRVADICWFSFNARWTFEMGGIFNSLIQAYSNQPRHLVGKPCVQVFTFGQHNKRDFGNNHRPLWRLMWSDAKLYPEHVKVPSWRQRNGDKRAAPGGRVPGDVFDMQYPLGDEQGLYHAAKRLVAASHMGLEEAKEAIKCALDTFDTSSLEMAGDVLDFPRVTGNSKQRCDWHPTQLHEELVERCIRLSTVATDRTIDPFGGTGTTMRVCEKLDQPCTLIELDEGYCRKIVENHKLKTLRTPGGYGK